MGDNATWFGYNIIIKEEIIIPDEETIENNFEQDFTEPYQIIADQTNNCTPCLVDIRYGINPFDISSCKKRRIPHRKKKNSKFIKCDRCKDKFLDLKDFENHTCPTYECDLCGKKFDLKWKLVPHFRKHHENERYQCDECKSLFLSKYSLSRHFRSHTGEKPFKCYECGKSFTQSGILNRHIMTHTNEKPYECDVCGKKFTRCYSVKRHYLQHLGVKPYQCDKCGKSFTRDVSLSKHNCI